MNRCSQRRTTVARDRDRPLSLATATGLRADRARVCQPPLSRASGERRSVHERRSRAQAQRARKFARAFWWGARTASATPPGLLIYGNTMTVTDADTNRNDNPDVLQQPQFEHMDTMVVTDADMHRNDIPDFLQQPQFGLLLSSMELR